MDGGICEYIIWNQLTDQEIRSVWSKWRHWASVGKGTVVDGEKTLGVRDKVGAHLESAVRITGLERLQLEGGLWEMQVIPLIKPWEYGSCRVNGLTGASGRHRLKCGVGETAERGGNP